MTKDEIIEMARASGFMPAHDKRVQHFAKLVEQRKVNQVADACAKLPFGDTAQSFSVWIREQ